MKFKEIYALGLRENLEFDLIAGDEEIPFTLVPADMSSYGRKVFAKLLEADIELITPPPAVNTTNVIVFNDDKLTRLAKYFTKAAAGYCPADMYDKLFVQIERYPNVRVVAQKLFKQLLSLGSYRYAVQTDGTTDKIIYAWNDEEAMKMAGFQAESAM